MPITWPGRRPTLAPDVQQALAEVERLAGERDELADAARILQQLLVASFGVPDPEPAPSWPGPAIPAHALREAVAGGRPAFAIAPPPLDRGILAERVRRLCAAVRADNPGVAVIERAIGRAPDAVAGYLAQDLAGDEPSLPPGVDVGRRETWACLVRLAALPTFSRLAAQVEQALLGAVPPDRADCPACGEAPVLAEERGLERRRWLRCGRCAGSWPAARLACPGCGTADHRLLRHLAVEGEEGRRRVVVCGSCDGRLKVVATLGPLSAPGLLVAELAASHLDYVGLPAADRGEDQGTA